MRYGEKRLLSEYEKSADIMNTNEWLRVEQSIVHMYVFDFESVRLTTQLRVWFTYANLYGRRERCHWVDYEIC